MNFSKAGGSNLPAYSDKAANENMIRTFPNASNYTEKLTLQSILLRDIVSNTPSSPGGLLLLGEKEIEEKLGSRRVLSSFKNCCPLRPKNEMAEIILGELLEESCTTVSKAGASGKGDGTGSILKHDSDGGGRAANPLDVLS